ncbi:MAG: TPM domain-containing protein [Beijerinckiaceae bacterium]
MTDLMSLTDRDRIAASIRHAELRTSGEILVLVARTASDYWAIPVLWAAIAALAMPWPLIWLTSWSAYTIHLMQMIAFAVLALLFSLPRSNRIALVPRFLRRRRARQMAREHFFTQGLHRTMQRTGVMIFVAVTERYAEVLVDDGIADRVDDGVWREVVTDLVAALRDNRMGDGLVRAVEECAVILADHVPPVADDQNELPDKVILI